MRRVSDYPAVSELHRAPAGRSRRRTPADHVLALQRTAGNRAVCALLARAPQAKPKPAPKEAPATEERTSHVAVPEIGTIPLESFSWIGDESHGGAGPGKAEFTGIQLTTPTGKHSPKLYLAVSEGRYLKDVVIVYYGFSGEGVRITLKDVVGTSFQYVGGSGPKGGESETWSLSFREHKLEYIGGGS